MNWTYIREVGYWQWFTRTCIRQFYKRVLRRGVYLDLPTGMRYYCPPWDQAASECFVTKANADWGSEAKLASMLDPEGTFIDVGAHTGYYSLYMLPLVKYVAPFEPDPKSLKALRTNGIIGIRSAISNYTGLAYLRERGGGFSYISNESQKNGVNVERIDDRDYLSKVTAIKIDIDGTDLDALEGALETIKRDQPTVLTELDSGETERLFDICDSIGYEVSGFFRFSAEETIPVWCEGVSRDFFKRTDMRYKMLFLTPGVSDETGT